MFRIHLKNFVSAQVGTGKYADPDEFVAELIKPGEPSFERITKTDQDE